MALIKCPECSRDVSDKAPSCPHCGYPFAPSSSAVEGGRVTAGEAARILSSMEDALKRTMGEPSNLDRMLAGLNKMKDEGFAAQVRPFLRDIERAVRDHHSADPGKPAGWIEQAVASAIEKMDRLISAAHQTLVEYQKADKGFWTGFKAGIAGRKTDAQECAERWERVIRELDDEQEAFNRAVKKAVAAGTAA